MGACATRPRRLDLSELSASLGGGLRPGLRRRVRAWRSELQGLVRRMLDAVNTNASHLEDDRPVWQAIFESTDAPVAAVDRQRRFIAFNSACREQCLALFGVAPEIGGSLDELAGKLPEEDARAVLSLWDRALAGEEFVVRQAFGADVRRTFQVKWNSLRNKFGDPVGAYQYAVDISELSEAEAQLLKMQEVLRQAQKMEAVGQLTGGIAHDFNNLLQVIGGNLQLLSRDVAGNPRAELKLDHALEGVSRAARLTSQLLAFSRRQPLEPRVVNLSVLVRGMDDLLRRTLGEAVEVETVASGGLWNTLVDPSQVENALLNLAINARDAMDGRGKLTIEVGNASLDEQYASSHAEVEPGQYVLVAVSDTGCGMTPEVAERVFEPFFSTKPEGKGTGLGLSMVFGFVKQSGGHIKIYSEVGHGTTIKIYLPRTQQPQDVIDPIDTAPVTGGDEVVLLVEDDDSVRETVAQLLRELGYSVLKARDAAAALTIIESGAHIDVLFTDVVMPGELRSPDLAKRATDRLPGLKVLFTSGYTANAIVHGGRLDAGVQLLTKPYSREALARKLRAVISRTG